MLLRVTGGVTFVGPLRSAGRPARSTFNQSGACGYLWILFGRRLLWAGTSRAPLAVQDAPRALNSAILNLSSESPFRNGTFSDYEIEDGRNLRGANAATLSDGNLST